MASDVLVIVRGLYDIRCTRHRPLWHLFHSLETYMASVALVRGLAYVALVRGLYGICCARQRPIWHQMHSSEASMASVALVRGLYGI